MKKDLNNSLVKILFYNKAVSGSRFELPRLFKRHPLKVVRLPISPPGYLVRCKYIFIRYNQATILKIINL